MNKNIVLTISSIVASIIFATWTGEIYNDLFKVGLGGSVIGDTSFWGLVIGFPLALIFFTVFFFTLFGKGREDKWMMGVLILPTLFQLFDLIHIYFPIFLGLVAYGLAMLLKKVSLEYNHRK